MLEICVEDQAGLVAAVRGGADRIELCAALGVGGVTPSAGAMQAAADCGRPVVALVRPRAGDFVYDAAERAQMALDVRAAAKAGLAGVAIGAATPADALDHAVLRPLVAIARDAFGRGAILTLHRVCDLHPDPCALVDEACALGFDVMLTSGGATTALAGAARIAAMVERAAGRIAIMAGAGVDPATAGAILDRTGAHALHASARADGAPVDPRLAQLGFAPAVQRRTSEAMVRALADLLRSRQVEDQKKTEE